MLADEHPEVTQYRQPVPVQVFGRAIILGASGTSLGRHYEAAERESGEEFPDARNGWRSDARVGVPDGGGGGWRWLEVMRPPLRVDVLQRRGTTRGTPRADPPS